MLVNVLCFQKQRINIQGYGLSDRTKRKLTAAKEDMCCSALASAEYISISWAFPLQRGQKSI